MVKVLFIALAFHVFCHVEVFSLPSPGDTEVAVQYFDVAAGENKPNDRNKRSIG